VTLAAVVTARLEHRQRELFAAALADQSQSLAILINRLSNRLGRERVGRPALTRDAVPERAWQLAPLTSRETTGATATKTKPRSKRALAQQAARKLTLFSEDAPSAAPLRAAATRPLTLLSPPRPLEVVALAPEGPPVQFIHGGQRQRVVRHWGPERIETAWWRGASVRRDYYRVETDSGEGYWIFRELREWGWFLHGAFG
jgi:protein ImuB